MLIRPYRVTDVRDYFVGAKQGGGYGQTIDKTGVKCIELIGASFLADEPAIFGEPNTEYIQKEIDWYDALNNELRAMAAWLQLNKRRGFRGGGRFKLALTKL